MRKFSTAIAFTLLCFRLSHPAAEAQVTSYPMLMSLKPVAAQVGQTSEHELTSRYTMHGAYEVWVSGEGVTGEVVTPMDVKPGEKTPDLTKIKLKFTVASDAKPGVRDFRLATPNGASTLGQVVIARDPVVAEQAKNDTLPEAQPIEVPATVCGTIEKAEDVDLFKFQVEAGRTLTLHVRSMRLQDRIHDLQSHVDPILAIRSGMGTTLAQSDNVFAADPLITHTFKHAGEYYLEIRDVRYTGNRYWEYAVEISDRPFVGNVHPLGVARGRETKLQLIGSRLPADPSATLSLAADAPTGPQWLQLPLAEGLSDPVPVVVSDLPLVEEVATDNNTPANAQRVPAPVGINGRIESEADLDCYTFEAKKGERYTIEIIARRMQSELDSVVRILNDKEKSLVENDDLRLANMIHGDSQIEFWAPPADGRYTIEVRDLHLRGGPGFVYYLSITKAEPHFELWLDTDKTQLTPGTTAPIFVRVVRKNGFKGEVQLAIDGLPAGVTASCGRILPEKSRDGVILLTAAADAKLDLANVTVTGTATHANADGSTLELTATAEPQQEVYMPGGGRSHWPVEMHSVSVGAPGDIRAVKLGTYDVTLKPGESVKIDVEIERAPDFKQNVTLDTNYTHLSGVFGDSLPPGVTIDTKKSKTLLTGTATKGHVTLVCAKDAAPAEKQQVAVMAHLAINFVMKSTYAASPLTVTVAAP